jgi:hypothetical protein
MKFKFLNAALVGLILSSSCLVNVADASLITLGFDEQPIGNCAFVGTSMTSQGVQFQKTGNTTGFYACDTYPIANNVSKAMIDANSRSQFDMGMFGSSFDLLSFDAGSRITYAEGYSTGIQLTGNFFGGGTISTDILFNGLAWDNFNLTGFNNLTSVSWLALGANSQSQFAFDNIIINDAPSSVAEPTTLAIFALGMIGLASRRFKKQS